MRRWLALGAFLLLAACGAAEEVGAPLAMVERATYVHDAPPSLTLVTVVSNRTGRGAHSALVVNGSERVVFDPAGTFNYTRAMPERGDVLYGLSPEYYRAYIDYHTRETYRTIEQTVPVSAETAEAALRLVRAQGAAPKGTCARATTAVLSRLPGFEDVPRSWWPLRVSEAFGARPGVRTQIYRDDDPDDNADLRARAL